jgi:hypothetical protein
MVRKIALTLFLLITAAVIAILAIAGIRPATYHVERNTLTSAPPQTVFAIVNDLNRFHEWSPWQKLDPAMKTSIEGSGIGAGSAYSWTGNDQVGEGRMSIMASTPANHVAMKLEFLKPWKSTSDVNFRIVPEGDGTRVTWAMDGNNNFMAKVMTLFMSMDNMIGRDFDRGLANLKQVSESAAAAPAAAPAAPPADSTARDSAAAATH